MTPSLAPEWIEASSEEGVDVVPINFCTLVVRCSGPKNLFVDIEQLVFNRLDPLSSFVE